VASGTALTAHGGTRELPLARISRDQAGAARGGTRNQASPQLVLGGLSPVTATGRAILASGQHHSTAHRVRHAHLVDRSKKHVRQAGPAHQARHGGCASSTLHRWVCAAEHTLEQHGVSRGRLSTGAAYIVVKHESGGNPHAYNGWDSNAAAGHPSEGIAQVIGPTFHSYALPGHHNIWNPVDNMIAAFRYAISRYGSMNNIPGVVAVRHGGSYMGY
jgi:hypothetical protein